MHLTRVGQRRSLALALGTLIAAGLIPAPGPTPRLSAGCKVAG